ncbi:UNVERIFIED_CONTAM: hypothetical protein Sindi_0516700 [Sesamum indicum]
MPRRKFPMGQSRYFYTPTWTKKVDAAFCTFLHVHAIMGNPQTNPRHPMNPAFLNACDALNDYAKRNWSYGFFLSRLHILGLRYDTFSLLLKEPNIKWNQNSNRMSGSGEDWRRIIRVHPFAKAYYYFGEPKWEQLQEIFGGEHNVQDTNTSKDVGDFSLDGSINSDVQFLGWKQDEEPEVIDLVTTEDEN